MFVKDGNLWKPSTEMYVNRQGTWKRTGPRVQQIGYYTKIRFSLCGQGIDSDFGGFSYREWTAPNGLYIPQGYGIKGIRFQARYDVVADGVFFAQSAALANALGNPRRKALILARRANPGYVGRNVSDTGYNIEAPGIKPSEWDWSTPSWGYIDNGLISNSGNMMSLNIYTVGLNANMCGGVSGGPQVRIQLNIPNNYTLPFPIDQIVSVRFSDDCGGKRRFCNHYLCGDGGGSYLEFKAPYSSFSD